MKISINRSVYTANSTIGQLFVDGKKVCDTLEDFARPPGAAKVYGRTAIPSGAYNVVVTHSPRFGRPLPLLIAVPGFEGVRIHPGNDANNTEGCILVGTYDKKKPDWVSDSRKAFNVLYNMIMDARANNERITITIEENHPGAA